MAAIFRMRAVNMECVCGFQGEKGLLTITDEDLNFVGRHCTFSINFSDIAHITKRRNKKLGVLLHNSEEIQVFGPFDSISRLEVLENINEALKKEKNKINDPVHPLPEAPAEPKKKKKCNKQHNIETEVFDKNFKLGTDLPKGKFSKPNEIETQHLCLDMEFSADLRQIFAILFADSSSFLVDFHKQEGDEDVKCNAWSLDQTGSYFTRCLQYQKNSKLVRCNVEQIQDMRLAHSKKLLVETSSTMTGVPCSKSFTVGSKWRLTEEDGKCRIRIWMQVLFSSNTGCFVRSSIERNSISGTIKYYKRLGKSLREKVNLLFSNDVSPLEAQNPAPTPTVVSQEDKVEVVKTQSRCSWKVLVLALVGLAFFVLWVWYWRSNVHLSSHVAELELNNWKLESMVNQLDNFADLRTKLEQLQAQFDILAENHHILEQQLNNCAFGFSCKME